jgi:hypothetical protein
MLVYKAKDGKGVLPGEEVEVLHNPLSGEGSQITLRLIGCLGTKMMMTTMMMWRRD